MRKLGDRLRRLEAAVTAMRGDCLHCRGGAMPFVVCIVGAFADEPKLPEPNRYDADGRCPQCAGSARETTTLVFYAPEAATNDPITTTRCEARHYGV